jgi:hypothetical protein
MHWHMIIPSIIAGQRAQSVAGSSSRKIQEEDATRLRKKQATTKRSSTLFSGASQKCTPFPTLLGRNLPFTSGIRLRNGLRDVEVARPSPSQRPQTIRFAPPLFQFSCCRENFQFSSCNELGTEGGTALSSGLTALTSLRSINVG